MFQADVGRNLVKMGDHQKTLYNNNAVKSMRHVNNLWSGSGDIEYTAFVDPNAKYYLDGILSWSSILDLLDLDVIKSTYKKDTSEEKAILADMISEETDDLDDMLLNHVIDNAINF